MPTLSEFLLTIGRRHDEATDARFTTFKVETVRQFSSFQYAVEVDDELDSESKTLKLALKGVQTPVGIMSSSGSGVTERTYPELNGEYTVQVSGAKQEGSFRFRGHANGIELLGDAPENFVQIRVDDSIEVIRA